MEHSISMLTTEKDWDRCRNTGATVMRPPEWEESVREQHPILKKYYERGQFDRYVTTAALLGLSYKEYFNESKSTPSVILPMTRKVMPALLASELASVQPMTAPLGTLFKMKVVDKDK
jgi:hypothetical protein